MFCLSVRIFFSFTHIEIEVVIHLGKAIYQIGLSQPSTYDISITLLRNILTCNIFDSSSLTPLHIYYIELCLRSSNIDAGLLVANIPIYTIYDPKITGLTVTDVLKYFYLCGHLYIATENWLAATNIFRLILFIPCTTNVLSTFTIASYKKWILLSLLSTPINAGIGSNNIPLTEPVLPRSISPVILKNIEKLSTPYTKLSKIFITFDRHRLLQYVSENTNIFLQDNNMDLVRALIDSIARRRIVRLAQTYTSVGLNDVWNEIGHDITYNDSINLLYSMINNQELSGNMDMQTNMLIFYNDNDTNQNSSLSSGINTTLSSSSSSSTTIDNKTTPKTKRTKTSELGLQLQNEIQSITEAISRLEKMDHDIQLDKAWMQHLIQTKELISNAHLSSTSNKIESNQTKQIYGSAGTGPSNMMDEQDPALLMALAQSLQEANR